MFIGDYSDPDEQFPVQSLP